MLIHVPLSWLREYVDITIPVDDLAHRLHMSGTEVKGIERRAWEGIWVGRIAELSKHPNADKLWLATVDYGEGKRKTVVTGAPNLAVGAVVPYGEVGAEYFDTHSGKTARMVPAKLRGIQSEGMVMSEKELGLGDDHDGILLLDPKLPVGAPLGDVLGEVTLALELQPNRPDCVGIVGIAREVAALLDVPLREPPADSLPMNAPQGLDVRIKDPHACPRFAAALLTGVRTGESPKWMQERLLAAGMRSIDVVVDVTNYVMLELGQPLHAYDLAQVKGGTLVARQARTGETVRTLDGVDRALSPDTLVIADEERALGIAGIMGGEDSEIRAGTTTIALECASFEPRGIGRTATRLQMRGSSGSAAARRFAWELSPDLVPIALARAVRLLREHAGAKVTGVVDRYPAPRAVPNVRVTVADLRRVLGIDVTRDEAVDALQRLHFTVALDGERLTATPPAVRTDIAITEDLVEEVARIVGYDRLPVRMPDGPLPLAERHPFEELRERVRDALAACGLQEIVSYALIDPAWLGQLTADGTPIAPEPLRITNPTSVTQSVARPTLRASLLDTARRNLRHRDGVELFEIAPVYLPRLGDLPDERWTAAILVSGAAGGDSWIEKARDHDLWALKGIVRSVFRALHLGQGRPEPGAPGLHPGRSETHRVGEEVALVWGQLDPRVAERWELPEATFLAEIDLRRVAGLARPPLIEVPPRYPAALRDLALVVDERVAYGDVAGEIRAAGKDLERVSLLDVYRGTQVGLGKKSFAVRLVFRSATATLSDEDVERALKRIEGRLLHKLGAVLRG